MSFFDNFGKKVTDTTAKAVQKTKGMSDVARLNSMIADEESNINQNYNQIGKLYVINHENDFEDDYASMIHAIRKSNENIRNYRNQIQDIKGVTRCLNCGAENPKNALFCNACGNKMPEVQVPETNDLIRCESCGAMIQRGMRFCTECGTPVAPIAENYEAGQTPDISIEQEDIRTCANCGAALKRGLAFCTKCGTKL